MLEKSGIFSALSTSFVRWLLFAVIALAVISAFLSHWSLLDGAPRNSFNMFLEGQAHRPFAYRILGPWTIDVIDKMLPESVRLFLADWLAPKFYAAYVNPLINVFEPQIPGITIRANADWSAPYYRRAYVLMVIIIWASFFSSMLVIRRCCLFLQSSSSQANLLTLLYAAIIPTLFLNGGYFYDFIEQLGTCLLILFVLRQRYLPALITLLIMQVNKETSFLLLFFLLPIFWSSINLKMLSRYIVALLLCIAIYAAIRLAHEDLPGQALEWHLRENVNFWSSSDAWTKRYDFYSLDIHFPRITFLLFALGSFVVGSYHRSISLLASSILAFVVLSALLLSMGYQDEFRNLSLSVPLLVLLWVKKVKKTVPAYKIKA